MKRFGHGAQHIRCFVDPASLPTGFGINIAQSSPKPECAIAGGQFRRHSQAPLLKPFEQVAPAIGTLPEPIRDRQHILLAVFISTNNNQHTLAMAVQARREVDPVGPQVDVALACEITLAPGFVFVLPTGFQPRDRRG